MNKLNITLIILAVAAAGFFLWAWNQSHSQLSQISTVNGLADTATTSSSGFEPKTSSDGWAQIEVTPLALGTEEWSFTVNLNAHQEMAADLMKAATLTDDRGDTLAPLRWEGPNLGSHHQQGTLVFSAPTSKPQSITLTIKDVGGAAVRTFTWQLP